MHAQPVRRDLRAERVREFLKKNPRFAKSTHKAPHKVSSTAADLVYEGQRSTGIENILRLSPPGSSNTCCSQRSISISDRFRMPLNSLCLRS